MDTTPAASATLPTPIVSVDDLQSAVHAFQASPNPQIAVVLRNLRWQLVNFILQQPADTLPSLWVGVLRSTRDALKASGLRELVCETGEEPLLRVLRANLSQDWTSHKDFQK